MTSSMALSALEGIYRPRRTAVAVNTREEAVRLEPRIDYEALNNRVFNPGRLEDGRVSPVERRALRKAEPAA